MRDLVQTRLTAVWLLLVAATFLGWELVQGSISLHFAQGVILLIALIKVRLVVMEFMELRHAPWRVRWVFDLWAVLLWAGITGMPWIAPHFAV
jgi:hypothetical protein